jgi:hypothetical protein
MGARSARRESDDGSRRALRAERRDVGGGVAGGSATA